MLRRFPIVPLLLISSTLQAAPPQVPGQSYEKDIQPLLKKYCWDCHAEGEKKGDLALDAFADEAAIWAGKLTLQNCQPKWKWTMFGFTVSFKSQSLSVNFYLVKA